MNATMRRLIIVISILVLASLACSFGAGQISRDGASFTVSLDEDQLDDLMENSNDTADDEDVLFDEVTGVDFLDDVIRVIGTYTKADGSTTTGSYDVSMKTKDGALLVEIIDVDIEGVTLEDPRIQKANKKIADDLARSANESDGEVEFTSVDITEESVTIQVQTHWEIK